MEELLILVDNMDRELGSMEKMKAHITGSLHRAFSVFIFNTKGEVLLQQRASEKYHSPDLWTNTCCSHPRFGEKTEDAVERRLMEEMGMECETEFAFSFLYRAAFENGLTEHEFDHVYFGRSEEEPKPEKSEVKDWKYVSLSQLQNDITKFPEQYTEWLKICLPKVVSHYELKLSNNL